MTRSKRCSVFAARWAALATLALACAFDVERDGEGKACATASRCAEGFRCNAQNRCVKPDPGIDAGAGGTGSGGADSGGAGAGQSGAEGSVAGQAGQGATPDGGISDACDEPVAYFPDDDEDGFGRNDEEVLSCTAPSGAWATTGGDCNDLSADAFPGQTEFFGEPHSSGAGPSFDYDCSNSEELDSSQPGAAPDCASLVVLSCSGSGYAETDRTGPGVNPLCGSTARVQCQPSGLVCAGNTSQTLPKRCR